MNQLVISGKPFKVSGNPYKTFKIDEQQELSGNDRFLWTTRTVRAITNEYGKGRLWLGIGIGIGTTALVGYGIHKVSKWLNKKEEK